MKQKDTLYARMLSGDVNASEIESLKASGAWEEIHHILRFIDEADIPSLDVEQNLKVLQLKKAEASQSKVRPLYTWPGIVAAASILLAIGWFLIQEYSSTTISTALGTTTVHQLPDSSMVILNDGAQIRYQKHSWEKERTIELIGEAYFKVVKGKTFQVQTATGTVQVLGTTFNVKSWKESFSVQCYTGKVKVYGNLQEFLLTKGEAVYFVDKKGIEKQHAHTMPTWTKATSTFYKEDLNEVFKEIERQFKIIIHAPNFDKKFTGSFNHDSLQKALYEVCTPMQITFKIDNNQKVTILE